MRQSRHFDARSRMVHSMSSVLSAKSRTRARESGSLRDAPVEVRLRTPVPCAPISYLAAGGGTTYAYGLRRDARCRHVAAVRLVWVSVRYRANVQSVSLCTAVEVKGFV